MSKKLVNQMYIEQSDIEDNTVEELLRKAIGRKRTGVVRMQYINGYRSYPRDINNIASIISYKFYREMECLEHIVDDRPSVDELMGSDLPWTGLVKFNDPVLDERYRVDGFVRPLVEQDNFIFMLRDLSDGSPYSDGLSIFDITTNKNEETKVITRTGLKQMEVVNKFQGYPSALANLNKRLVSLGYKKNGDGNLELFHEEKLISTIDVTLVGVRSGV